MMQKALYVLLYETGINSLWRLVFGRNKITLLGYHSIYSSENSALVRQEVYRHISLPAGMLRNHIEYLRTHAYEFLSLADLVAIRQGKKKIPRRSVLIYFDDGFRDTYLNAYPILKEQGVPAAIFLATDLIDQKKTLWDNVPVAQASNLSDQNRIFLNWEEARAMRDIFSFGSHGKSHPKFTLLSSSQMEEELVSAERRIQDELGVIVGAFSYPYGRSNAMSRELLARKEYQLGITTAYGFNDSNADWLRLKKISMKADDDMLMFKLKLGIFYPLRALLRR